MALAPLSAHAAGTPRYAHSATMLASGDVLVAGGFDSAGNPLATVEIYRTGKGGALVDVASMNVARGSHTATLMPDGRVLVTGGVGSGALPLVSGELYNPVTNTWASVANVMTHERFNHTATLLNDGRVLICGGQRDFLTPPTVNSSCNLFCTSNTQPGCSGAAGTFAAGATMQQARALHTAVLLKDGKVWFGGGWNPGVTPNYLATTERFDPALGFFNSAAPLSQGRAYHTATLMGHGKVLIAGGFNGDNATVNGNSFGQLKTVEIYDPVGNTVIPAASLRARRFMHAATLLADNTVALEGGLGNVTTTYLTSEVDGELLAGGSVITHTFGAGNALTTTTVTGGSASIGLGLYLGTEITGVIEDGEIWLSSPQAHVSGVADTYFTPSSESNPAVGLRIPLDGTRVRCDAQDRCGYITGNFAFQNYSGQTFFQPIANAADVSPSDPAISAGSLSFDATLGSAGNNGANITGGNLTANVLLAMPLQTVGATISSGTFQILSPGTGQVTKSSSFTATLTGGWATFSGQTVVMNALGNGGQVTIPLALTNLAGTVTADADAVSVASPQALAGAALNSVSGVLRFVASQLDLSNTAFEVDIATVVIRRMVLSHPEYYNPASNSWSSTLSEGQSESYDPDSRARFGGTSTLLVNNDVLHVGGRECDDASPTCASFAPKNSAGTRSDSVMLTTYRNWTQSASSLGTPRVFHTATALPDGRILVAGGSNGPNILRSAELLNPRTDAIGPTRQSMQEVRDLHTATLLPNGRVLIAGGFTTNATSTGSTSSSEIFYPDTEAFVRAGVMTSSRSNHTAVLLRDGNVLVAGGYGADDVITATAEIFYSTAMAWRQTASMPSPRALNTVTALKDGRVMLAGGLNAGGALSSVIAFDPASGAWTALASMPSALHSHTATLLADGRVLVAGGNDGLGEVDASYLYDPVTNAWTATPAYPGRGGVLEQPRYNHNATPLPNGDVVISGGVTRFGNITEKIEFFHNTAGLWVSSGAVFGSASGASRPRSYHTLTLAADNNLYAIGGSDGAIGGQGTMFYTTVEKAHFTADPDARMPNPSSPFQSPRQSSVTATSPMPFLPNTLFTVSGSQFRGGTEASGGGSASGHSSFSFPRLVLQALGSSGGSPSQASSGFVVDLTTQIAVNSGNYDTLNTSVTVLLPATNSALPYGWYHGRVGANDIFSKPVTVQVGPPKPSAAPTSVVSTALGSSSMSWTWTAVAGADGYNVYQSSTGVFLSTSGSTSFVQTGLSPNTTASILVAAFTLSGDGPLGVGATNYTFTSTVTQVGLSSVTFTSLLLQWNPAGNTPGTIYEVTQSTDGFAGSVSTPVPRSLGLTANQTTIGNLLPNTQYFFRVRAYNGAGVAGGYSSVISTITSTSVSAVNGRGSSPTSIDWFWADPGGVTNYRVYNATSGALLATLPGTAIGYADTGLGINSQRSILVSAVTAAGEGPLRASATVYTLANPPQFTSPPISSLTENGFTVNWSVNDNPGYTRYRSVVYEASGGALVADATGTGNNLAATGLQPGTLYVSSVAAFNEDGVATAWIVGSTYTAAQPALGLAVVNTTPVSISVTWGRQQNGPDVQYELTYSSDQFVAHVATAVPFSAGYTGSSATITGLLTGATYWLRVQARTPFGTLTAFEPPLPTLSTVTFNGGAPFGSLAGVISALSPSQIFGYLGNGRRIDVRAPAAAFPSDVTMTISSYNVTGTLCPNGVNVALSITNQPALQPVRPVFLTMSYAPGELGTIPANRVVLFRYEPVSRTCVPLETLVSGDTIRAQLNHFSLFQLGAVTLATTADTARVFPNPFRPSTDGYATIDNVPPDSRVRVLTLRGEQVADMRANGSGIATWRGTNGSGRAVASGLYLIAVEHGGSRKILKLSVIR